MNLKAILPHLLAVALFFLLTVVLYHPYFFQGHELYQHDILQAFGANEQLKQYRAETGEEPLWLYTMFSGMPAYLNGVQYSGDLLQYAYAAIRIGLPHPVGITFVCFVSFYVLLLAFKVRPWVAAAGAILFGLNGFNIISISAGHNAKIAAVALMPLVLAGVRLAYTNRRWLGWSLTALALGIQIMTNHPQMTYYLLFAVLSYGLVELFFAYRNRTYKTFIVSSAGLVLAAVLAIGANAGKLYHMYDYGKYSIRGKSELSNADKQEGLDYEYAFRYSNGISEPLVMFYPNILGGSSQQELSMKSNTAQALMREAGYSRMQAQQVVQSIPTYWGDQPLTAPYYAGSVLLFLLLLGILVAPRPYTAWLLGIAALGVLMSYGKNLAFFNNLLFDHLPMYNKFRSVTFAIILPLLAFNVLAFVGLEHWLKKEKHEQWTALKKAFLFAAGFGLLLLVVSGMLSYRGAIDAQLPDWLISALRDDRKSLLRMDVLRSMFFIVLATALLWAIHKGKLPATRGLVILLLLVSADGLLLSKRFLNKENFAEDAVAGYFEPTPADQFLMDTRKPGERVLNLQNPWNEARTSYYHESVGGYHGAKMRRYQDLIDAYLFTENNEAIALLQQGRVDFSTLQVLNMLNTKYMLAGTQKEAVVENTDAFGTAWIVKNLKTVQSADEEIATLGEVNLKETAVVDVSKFDVPNMGGSGSIELVSKTPDKVTYKATIDEGKALAVFSEIYYPQGWSATIDGQKVEILRANYLLRALEVPVGEHEIVFTFKPESYARLNWVMMVCGALVIVGFLGSAGAAIPRNNA